MIGSPKAHVNARCEQDLCFSVCVYGGGLLGSANENASCVAPHSSQSPFTKVTESFTRQPASPPHLIRRPLGLSTLAGHIYLFLSLFFSLYSLFVPFLCFLQFFNLRLIFCLCLSFPLVLSHSTLFFSSTLSQGHSHMWEIVLWRNRYTKNERVY